MSKRYGQVDERMYVLRQHIYRARIQVIFPPVIVPPVVPPLHSIAPVRPQTRVWGRTGAMLCSGGTTGGTMTGGKMTWILAR